MTRPLRYDDSFMSIVSEKLHDKFLNIFTIKVQSTAFCQKVNLKQSLFIISLIDFFVGLIVFLLFFRILDLNSEDGAIYIIENLMLILGMVFGLVGMDASANLKKKNASIYKLWRILITFLIPIFELINSLDKICYYSTNCTSWRYLGFTIVFLPINIYFTKIAWSFCVRLDRSHELLIIHGKYLEKMMNDEQLKMTDLRNYIPPELNKGTQNDHKEQELTNMFKTQRADCEEDIFQTKKQPNIFSNLRSGN
jgi:hypothetical protein